MHGYPELRLAYSQMGSTKTMSHSLWLPQAQLVFGFLASVPSLAGLRLRTSKLKTITLPAPVVRLEPEMPFEMR